jgi:hypothetical protein
VDDLVDLRSVISGDDVLPDIDAHGYLQGVYRGQIKPSGSRLRAAIASLPFEKPKLSALALVSKDDLVDRLTQALAASANVINSRPSVAGYRTAEG